MHEPIAGLFSADGAIARALPGFEARPGQVQMAQLVERGILEATHTLVEAGTGVGKSLAYLVPAVRSGKKIIISTGTIALQEQLFTKDLPLVARALGRDLRVTLLKGRSHFLCKQKYQSMHADRLLAGSVEMERLWAWAERTATGDRAELPIPPSASAWEQLDADADDCVGEACPLFSSCHFFRKREEAKFADIVVVNHALFFLDLAMGGGLLPAYDVAILDEAHQCERWASAALTSTLSRSAVDRTLRKLKRAYTLPREFDAALDVEMFALEGVLAQCPSDRYPLAANECAWERLDAVRQSLYDIENWVHAHYLDALRRRPENEAEAERRRDNALRSLQILTQAIDRAEQPDESTVAWVEREESDRRYAVCTAPFDVAEFLRTRLFAGGSVVVLTSATIADGESFAFLRGNLGIDDAQELVAASPFDYAKQARLYLAPCEFNPKDPGFARKAAPLIEECLDRTQGRAFVLFTAYERLREVYRLLHGRIAYPTHMQGDLSRTALLEWFRATPNAVLFATGTFWEGIDVVGDQLSCVIIDRLPFPSPSDPIVAAKVRALEARGFSGFGSYSVPMATVRLKQGFGRLIRSQSDRGVVAILDGRAASTAFGVRMLAALPNATRIDHLDELTEFFAV